MSGRKSRSCCSCEKCGKVSIGCGSALVLLSVLGIVASPYFMNYMITEQSKLGSASSTAESWRNARGEGTVSVYIWHVKNSEQVVKYPNKTIDLEQRGPFTYKLNIRMINASWSDDDLFVSYRRLPAVTFMPELSNGTEQDYVTAINLPIVALSHNLKGLDGWSGYFLKRAVVGMLNSYPDNELFVNKTVRDFLFGYDSPLDRIIDSGELAKLLKVKEGGTENGILTKLNYTDDGLFTMNTGVDDIAMRAKLASWNGQSSLAWWGDKYANMLNGSDGGMQKPGVSKDSRLYYFIPQMCRSLPLDFAEETDIQGIPTWKFMQPLDLYNYSKPENTGFCTPDAGNCPPNGLLNVSSCSLGAPVLISRPHFTGGNASLVQRFTGVTPNPELNSFFHVQPDLGLSLGGAQRMQVNVHISAVKNFKGLDNWPDTYFPFVWLDQSFEVTEAQASRLKLFVLATQVSNVAQYLNLALGGALIVLGAALLCWVRRHCRKPKDGSATKSSESVEAVMVTDKGLLQLGEEAPPAYCDVVEDESEGKASASETGSSSEGKSQLEEEPLLSSSSSSADVKPSDIARDIAQDSSSTPLIDPQVLDSIDSLRESVV